MPRVECFIHQSSSPSRVASLGSGQENIWRPDSRLGAKVSALPSSHPPPHFTPSLLVVTGPGKILLQTMPISGFVGLISGMLPKK